MAGKNETDNNLTLAARMAGLRKQRGWTLAQLADESQVSSSMLSQIERSSANPTLAITCRIAEAFGVSIASLVDQPWTGQQIQVIRAVQHNNYADANDQYSIQLLSPVDNKQNLEFYRVEIAAKGTMKSAAHVQGCCELFTVHQGAVTVWSGEQKELLETGDSAHYRADIGHELRNEQAEPCLGYLVVTYE